MLIFSALNFHGNEKRHLHLPLGMDNFQATLLSVHPPFSVCCLLPIHPSLSDSIYVCLFVAATCVGTLLRSLCYKLFHMGVSSMTTSMFPLLPCNLLSPTSSCHTIPFLGGSPSTKYLLTSLCLETQAGDCVYKPARTWTQTLWVSLIFLG